MPDELSRLQIAVESAQVDRATASLNKLTTAGTSAERATDGLTKRSIGLGAALTRVVAPMALLTAAIAGLRSVTGVHREFEVLQAQLRTATGSAEGAAEAFAAIKQLAIETPYDLAQVTDGFVKLVNYGLTPSREAIIAYGNTASALRRDMTQIIEAVADAAVGQYVRLKDLGILASRENGKVTLSFRGVTETINDSTTEIEGYLMRLGQNQFAGAMAERMKTLDGAISNFGDAWKTTVAAVGEAGIGSAIEASFRSATQALEGVRDRITSGYWTEALRAWGAQFTWVAEHATASIALIGDALDAEAPEWQNTVEKTGKSIWNVFLELPSRVRASVMRIGAVLYSIYAEGAAAAVALKDAFVVSLSAIADTAVNVGKTLKGAFNVFNAGENGARFFREQQKILEGFGSSMVGIGTEYLTARNSLSQALDEGLDDIGKEEDASIEAFQGRMNKARELWKKFNSEREAAAAMPESATDPLKKFSLMAPQSGDMSAKEKEEFEKRLAHVRTNLATELELEQAHFAERQAILEQAYRDRMITDMQYSEQSVRNTELFERKKLEIAENAIQTRRQIEMSVIQNGFAVAQQALQTIEQFATRGTALQKAAFFVSKAIAMAQTVVMANLAAMAALAPPPMGLGPVAGAPYAAAIRAMGYSSAALIGAQAIAENRTSNASSRMMDGGGYLGAGQAAVVGERGPELVHGPAHVTGREATSALGGVSVVVNNHAGVSVEANPMEDGKTLEILITKAEDAIARGIYTGAKPVAAAIERVYGTKRKGAR